MRTAAKREAGTLAESKAVIAALQVGTPMVSAYPPTWGARNSRGRVPKPWRLQLARNGFMASINEESKGRRLSMSPFSMSKKSPMLTITWEAAVLVKRPHA